MSELRKDPVVNRWVIISEERGKRPSDFSSDVKRQQTDHCPFCAGNEHLTPPAVLTYPDPTNWKLRVVPNKYPALTMNSASQKKHDGIFTMIPGVGAHEVMIESPLHHKDLSELSMDEFQMMFLACRDRLKALQQDIRLKYILVFKNHGSAAGATVEHSHSQIIATPIVPKTIQEEIDGANHYHHQNGSCVFCSMIKEEITDGRRVVTKNDDYIAIAPYASRFPFETWILPTRHQASFESESDASLKVLAGVFRETLIRIHRALENPPYNYVLHTGPVNTHDDLSAFHWHIEIIPKLTKVAGFEWGSGFFINPTPPEAAAGHLRQVSI